MKSALPLDRFKTLLAAYGARLELWPEAERHAAHSLLESSAEARELVQAEAGLDALFAVSEAPELSADLSRRLAELPIAQPQAQKLWPLRKILWPALCCALATAFGIVLGTSLPDPDSTTAEDTVVLETGDSGQALPSDDEARDDDGSELLEMALGSMSELEELP